MILFDPYWFILIHFNPYWSILIWFDSDWSMLIYVDPFWYMLIHFDPLWSILIHFDPILIQFDPILNISEYHPPIGIWIACRALQPLYHHTTTLLLQIPVLALSTSARARAGQNRPGQTAWPVTELPEWIWNFLEVVVAATILMTLMAAAL